MCSRCTLCDAAGPLNEQGFVDCLHCSKSPKLTSDWSDTKVLDEPVARPVVGPRVPDDHTAAATEKWSPSIDYIMRIQFPIYHNVTHVSRACPTCHFFVCDDLADHVYDLLAYKMEEVVQMYMAYSECGPASMDHLMRAPKIHIIEQLLHALEEQDLELSESLQMICDDDAPASKRARTVSVSC